MSGDLSAYRNWHIKIPIQVHALARRQGVPAAGSSYRCRTNSVFGAAALAILGARKDISSQRGPLSTVHTTRAACFSHAKSRTQSSQVCSGPRMWQLLATSSGRAVWTFV
ncbi:hypothetical protein VC83_09625 [Pseudogymnoascus destructans]|uniref:Uncharacterized protein n=1 Tax=Pseudogymnoascus destructans TaxID=655981 RepID=A0A2P6FGJ2_9PEZI|nr:uncharacterized protein VC83_09625 [Pseudogymnoascus destructans]PQM43498.1 hypothetical protein VC83_09625 [Pseudogymnoascus destructans]